MAFSGRAHTRQIMEMDDPDDMAIVVDGWSRGSSAGHAPATLKDRRHADCCQKMTGAESRLDFHSMLEMGINP